MENKSKIYKSTINSNLNSTQKDLSKQKILKKDVKIVKGNKRPSTATVTKSININTNNVHQNIHSNHPPLTKKNNQDKNNVKKNNKIIINNKNSHLNKNIYRYNNLEEAVLFLQKEIRKFLHQKKNDPKNQMIEKLKQKKIDILHNYKIIDKNEQKEKEIISTVDLNFNDFLKNIKTGKKSNYNNHEHNDHKNNNNNTLKEEKHEFTNIEDTNNNLKKKNSNENNSTNNNNNKNNNNLNNNNKNKINNNNKNKINDNNIISNIDNNNNNIINNIDNDNNNIITEKKNSNDIQKEENEEIKYEGPNSDLKGLDDKYNIDDIEEEIIKNYKVEPKNIKLIDKKPVSTSGRKKQELNIVVLSKKDEKEKNNKTSNQENIFERIAKGMQKDKNEKKKKIKRKRKIIN